MYAPAFRMSATTSSASDAYNDTVTSFVAFWGEMASQWGINRTMAQIHARLFCADAPMNTDEIMEALDISRGNANMNLRSLCDWQLVSKTRLPDSRKDYYEADTNVWRITARIIEERQRRELQPVQAELEECRAQLPAPDSSGATARTEMLHERLDALIDLMEAFESVSEVLLPLVQQHDTDTLTQLVQMARLVAAQADAASDEGTTPPNSGATSSHGSSTSCTPTPSVSNASS